ncbi:MAG: thiazole biosynthesis adenylyltransferase ThiF [Acidobacteria bacterium]|jgi:adenylyltransferase/sulfurtransferase|nr:MAG: thiazole biosynthesis adenylyltransferase ThiF [Acidobacteriota bacterium]GIU81892.1 MAG: thiamine/molybdopterin biosynthesis protein MoeB [Pyrinomonadaceae bacterium]
MRTEFTDRYSRQILFLGREKQERLANSSILIVGCGALGAAQAEMLARAGIGRLKLVDRDFVEFSNLQRQILYDEKDAEERIPKAVAAKRKLELINSEITVESIVADVNNSNIERFIADVDLVLDGTDNFQTRYLINDACVKHGKIWIYGAAVSAYGATMTVIPNQTPCLRCLFDQMPDAGSSPTCDTVGIIQPIIFAITSIQVAEALKILTGEFDKLHRSLMQIDLWQNEWRKLNLKSPNKDCPCCQQKKFEFLEAETKDFASVLCGRNAVQIAPLKTSEINLNDLAKKLEKLGSVKQNEFLLRFKTDEFELTIFNDARAIIRGTEDVALARSIYSKFVGN